MLLLKLNACIDSLSVPLEGHGRLERVRIHRHAEFGKDRLKSKC